MEWKAASNAHVKPGDKVPVYKIDGGKGVAATVDNATYVRLAGPVVDEAGNVIDATPEFPTRFKEEVQ